MTNRETYDPNRYIVEYYTDNLLEIQHPLASCSLGYEPRTGDLHIEWLEVRDNPAVRRRGIGQNILRYTVELAQEAGVRTIRADIISRESLAACSRVFGDESLTIRREGNFGDPPGRDENFPDWFASAKLEYPLTPDSSA